jgi:hypothetical protein
MAVSSFALARNIDYRLVAIAYRPPPLCFDIHPESGYKEDLRSLSRSD